MELLSTVSEIYSIKNNIQENDKQHNAYLTSARLFGNCKERYVKNPKPSSLSQTEMLASINSNTLIQCFSSLESEKIQSYCSLLQEAVKKFPAIAENIMSNEAALTTITEVMSSGADETIIYPIILAIDSLMKHADATQLVNSDIIFSALSLIDSQPILGLKLLKVLAGNCSYAADGIVSCGLVTSIIETITNATEECLAVEGSETLFIIARNIGQMGRECCEPLVLEILPLLQIQQANIVSNVMIALSFLVESCTQCTYTLYSENVHQILCQMIGNEEIVSAVLTLTETMAKTESSQDIQMLIDCELLIAIAGMLPESVHAAKVFRVLTTAFQSAPENMRDIISLQFLSLVSTMSEECDFDVYKELANFAAVVVIYSPSDLLAQIIGTGIANAIIEMLESGLNDIVMHCLQALYRILSLSEQDSELGHVAGIFLDSIEHVESLENLVENEDKFISASAQLVLNELDKNATEQL